jgi:hypothetical protein
MNAMQKWMCMSMVTVVAFAVSGCQSESQKAEALLETAQPPQLQTAEVAKPQPAAPAKKATVAIPADAPIVKVTNAVYDFGAVGPDSKDNKGQFEFTNVGNSILKVDHVQSTCGCTVPELNKKEYQPGEVGTITFTFHAPAYAGNVTKHLYIVSNDPANPRTELALKAVVEVKVVSDPNRVELVLNKENAGMPSIKVKSLDNTPFSIISFNSSSQAVTCQFDSNVKQVEHTLNPVVDVNKLGEMNTGTLQIGVDHPKAKQLLVTYNALPMYELRPGRLVIQNAEPNVAVKRQVGVVNNYGQAFEIESIQSSKGLMKVVDQKKDGNNMNLEIEITPAKQEGAARRYITDELNVKIKDGPTLTVRCSGWYKL